MRDRRHISYLLSIDTHGRTGLRTIQTSLTRNNNLLKLLGIFLKRAREILAFTQVQTDIVENLVLISDIRDTYLVRTTWTHTLNSIATIYICYSTIHSTRWLVCSSNRSPNNGFAIGRNLTTNARSGNLSHCRSHHEGEQSQK